MASVVWVSSHHRHHRLASLTPSRSMEAVGLGYHIHLACIHGPTRVPRYSVSWTNVAAAVSIGQCIPAEAEAGRLAVEAEEAEVEAVPGSNS